MDAYASNTQLFHPFQPSLARAIFLPVSRRELLREQQGKIVYTRGKADDSCARDFRAAGKSAVYEETAPLGMISLQVEKRTKTSKQVILIKERYL